MFKLCIGPYVVPNAAALILKDKSIICVLWLISDKLQILKSYFVYFVCLFNIILLLKLDMLHYYITKIKCTNILSISI